MADKPHSFIVVLERDIWGSDAESVKFAIEQIRGVVGVTPITDTPEASAMEYRARIKLGRQVVGVLNDHNITSEVIHG